MLKVTIDLWPYGNKEESKTISSFFVANDGTGNYSMGNYLFKKNEEDKWEKSVQGHYRSEGVEKLIEKVLEKHFD